MNETRTRAQPLLLGGAEALQTRVSGSGAVLIMLPLLLGLLAWGGIWLRDERLRNLIPLRAPLVGREITTTTPTYCWVRYGVMKKCSAENVEFRGHGFRLLTRSRCTMLTCGGRAHRVDGCGLLWPFRWRWDWPS